MCTIFVISILDLTSACNQIQSVTKAVKIHLVVMNVDVHVDSDSDSMAGMYSSCYMAGLYPSCYMARMYPTSRITNGR